MARDPEASPTSTPTSFSSAIESDATVIDATVPVLTPATSISEHSMSSGHEKSQNDRNGTKASRRVTRLSLKEAGWKDTNDNTNENTRLGDKAFAIDENPQEIVGQVPGSQEIRPILPPGSSAHTEAGDARSQVINDDSTQLNGEPASPSNDSDNAVMSTDEMSLTREDGTSTKGGNGAKRRRRQTDITKATCSRRSTRLSLLDKSQELAQTAPSTLGKRKLDAVPQGKDMGKIPNRRASLRPRIENQRDNVQSSTPVAPLSKKRRLSEGDGDVSKVVAQPEAPKRENSLIRQMKKTWLKHGLFAGQNYVDQSVLKTKKRKGKVNAAESQQSPVFPLPMYAGARLLEKGRDYKLPFDIFSPLPYRQPKPNEWRKANKSIYESSYERVFVKLTQS